MVYRGKSQVLKILVFLVFASVLLLSRTSKAETLTYKDKLNRLICVSIPVKRCVFFITHDLISCLEIWDKVVGISRWAYDNELIKATRPDIAREIPELGSGSEVDIEKLLKVRPELVITWSIYPETVRFMEEKGLKVIAIYPESFEELYEVMRLQGRLFKREERMEDVIGEMEKIFSLIKERVSKIPEDKRKKVLQLGGRPTRVSCGIGVNNDIFELIRGINPASEIKQRYVDVSLERIIAWNPDVLFIWGHARYKAGDILDNSQWRFIKAVREEEVYKAPEWSTWSPQLAPIALWMAARTYPEYFRDVDLDRVFNDFYQKVFGISYSKVGRIEE